MRFARALPLAGALAATGCVAVGHPSCLRWHEYLSAPVSEETRAHFAELELKEQYAVHVCGLRFTEPPLTGVYAPGIARRGALAVLFLRKKLAGARDAGEVYGAVDVLREMQAAGTYDVAGDAPLMSTLDHALARVPADEWKTRAASAAREIRRRPSGPAR
jgi:hypothetical protein